MWLFLAPQCGWGDMYSSQSFLLILPEFASHPPLFLILQPVWTVNGWERKRNDPTHYSKTIKINTTCLNSNSHTHCNRPSKSAEAVNTVGVRDKIMSLHGGSSSVSGAFTPCFTLSEANRIFLQCCKCWQTQYSTSTKIQARAKSKNKTQIIKLQ